MSYSLRALAYLCGLGAGLAAGRYLYQTVLGSLRPRRWLAYTFIGMTLAVVAYHGSAVHLVIAQTVLIALLGAALYCQIEAAFRSPTAFVQEPHNYSTVCRTMIVGSAVALVSLSAVSIALIWRHYSPAHIPFIALWLLLGGIAGYLIHQFEASKRPQRYPNDLITEGEPGGTAIALTILAIAATGLALALAGHVMAFVAYVNLCPIASLVYWSHNLRWATEYADRYGQLLFLPGPR